MSFTIFPAIDMKGGKCVRLLQGDYNQETIYGNSPIGMAKQFSEQGAEWIHMVDLDGAKDGKRVNDTYVIQVANELNVKVQIGGGIRSEQDIVHYLENGIERVIIGSIAVSNPSFAIEMLRKYREKIVIGLDARDGYVATHGWLDTSTIKAVELAKRFADSGAQYFIFTDIATDGMLTGPNLEAVHSLAEATGKTVIASGGVSTLADLRELSGLYSSGVAGAIVGKAIYEGRFTVAEALREVKNKHAD
jgi:phosphoribosylformimino-5-aminoimidazole carboxamide ribotide isomerase